MKTSQDKSLIARCDEAYREFSDLMEQVLAELDRHRAMVEEYDLLARRALVARDASCGFVVGSALALRDIRLAEEGSGTGATVLSLMRPGGRPGGSSLQ